MASATAEPTGISRWVVDVMETLGAPGAGLAIALENLFPPLPSEIILPLAGFTASQGGFSLASAIFWTTLGSVVGAFALYALGAWLGRDRMRALVDRMPLIKIEEVDKAESWFGRHGSKAVFFGRMLPMFRSFISIPAGIERMPLLRFGLLTTAGSLVWNTVFVYAGYALGENWHLVEEYAAILQLVVIAATALAIGWYLAYRFGLLAHAKRALGTGTR
ncbi:DedA family protein [Dietzia sp.]|uniref:DedA family protein n=1 Tax=Dietzia sp. TaxID=1871616 RepID=UPI002FD9ADB5